MNKLQLLEDFVSHTSCQGSHWWTFRPRPPFAYSKYATVIGELSNRGLYGKWPLKTVQFCMCVLILNMQMLC